MKQNLFESKDINLLIVSYFTGSISEEDLEKLNEWINTTIENRNHFNLLKNAWVLSGEKDFDPIINAGKSWESFKDKLFQDQPGLRVGYEQRSNKKIGFPKYMQLASSLLLMFCLGSAITWWLKSKPENITEISENRTIEISTPLGARSFIRMPDSSQIWINAGTTITYNEDYGHDSRTLSLVGEAYFKVAKDSLHPFIVNTKGIVVRALGTRFNIKAYPEEKTISATLEEGKIDVRLLDKSGKNETVLLVPKDKLIYHKATSSMEKYIESSEDKIKKEGIRPSEPKDINILSNVRTELYTSWKDPRWIIDREPLSTLAPMLERRFNLKIIFIDNQLKNYKFTGTIENETVDQILNALRLTAPLDYKINKDTLRLKLDIKSKEEFKRIMTRN